MRTRRRGAKERRGRAVAPATSCPARARASAAPCISRPVPTNASTTPRRDRSFGGVTRVIALSGVGSSPRISRPSWAGPTVTPSCSWRLGRVRGDIGVPWHIASHCVARSGASIRVQALADGPRLDTPVAGASMTRAPLLRVAGRCQSPDRGRVGASFFEAQLQPRRRRDQSRPGATDLGGRVWYAPPRCGARLPGVRICR